MSTSLKNRVAKETAIPHTSVFVVEDFSGGSNAEVIRLANHVKDKIEALVDIHANTDSWPLADRDSLSYIEIRIVRKEFGKRVGIKPKRRLFPRSYQS